MTLSDPGDLSEDDVQRIVREMMRQSAEEKKRALQSKSSFMEFLEDAGLFYIIRKIGDFLDWVFRLFT